MPLAVRKECPAEPVLLPRRGQAESNLVLFLTVAVMVVFSYDLVLLALLA